MNDNEYKRCTRCCQDLPATAEYFYRNKNHKDGLQYICKSCTKLNNDSYYVKNQDKRRKYAQEYRDANPEKSRETSRKSYKKHQVKWVNRARETRNSEEWKEYIRQYKKDNRVRYNEYESRRRAKKNGVDSEPVDTEELYKRDRGACYLCGVTLPPNGWVLEHKIPLSRGGSHTYENTGVSCAPCNSSKGPKTVEEYTLWLEGLDS